MISQVNSTMVRSAYTNNSSELKDTQRSNSSTSISKQGDMSKVETIKESIESGEYKINLQALSEKIAEELL